MKINKLLNLTALSFAVLLCAKVNAQAPDRTVNLTSTHNYSVTLHASNTYAWLVYTADASFTKGTAAPASDYTLTGSGNTVAITWKATGNFIIELVEKNSHDCSGPTQSMKITVAQNNSLLQFAALLGGNCSMASGSPVSIDLALKTGTLDYPITFNYTVDGTAYSTVISSGLTLVVPGTVNLGYNAGSADVTRSVVITSITDKYNGTVGVGAQHTYQYTVYGTPDTGAITQD